MSQFLRLSLLFVITLPVFAQEEPMLQERSLPRGSQTLLLRMRRDLTQELQRVQQMLSVANPSDTSFIDTLKAQQAELTKQIKDVSQQLQTVGVPYASEIPPESAAFQMGMPPGLPPTREPELPGMPRSFDSAPMPGGMMGQPPSAAPVPGYNIYGGYGSVTPYMPAEVPTWTNQNQAWGSSPWAPKPSKELTEMTQTVESLRKEIAELKTTVKALETQIQLLSRNILLSEKAKE